MRFLAAVLFFIWLPTGAHAQVITKCGASSGFGYYLPGPLVPSDKVGWQKDGISAGGIILVNRGENPQILYVDATQNIRDAELDDGGRVRWLNRGTDGHFVVVVLYGLAMEHFLFRLDPDGNGEVIWGSVKHATPITKSSLFRAECRKP